MGKKKHTKKHCIGWKKTKHENEKYILGALQSAVWRKTEGIYFPSSSLGLVWDQPDSMSHFLADESPVSESGYHIKGRMSLWVTANQYQFIE